MRKVKKTEIINITIEATETEKHQAITGSSIPVIASLLQRYVHRIQIYENAGYVITKRDEKNFSFTAKKESEETIDD